MATGFDKMKSEDASIEKPPLYTSESPPRYSSQVNLHNATMSDKYTTLPADNTSVHSVKCESKHPRRRRLLKILAAVVVVSIVAVLTGLLIKYAIQNNNGDDGPKIYTITVKNTTGNYQASASVQEDGRVVAIRDNRRASCFLYFPKGDLVGVHKDLFNDEDMSSTLTYKMTESPGYGLAVRVISESVSPRIMAAAAGTVITDFCQNHTPLFLEHIYRVSDNDEIQDSQRRSILVVQQ
eukprot:GHVR01192167.1.p1 GENE.GHVR01192167.1~~GHVR01192167.1.p1  ORF type:complete len:238 (-),score=30.64 GHVR01192167.1:633-1346(-)